MNVDDLKNKGIPSRGDIAKLLSSIGKPGEKQDEKIKAVEELGLSNKQGHNISVSLESYSEF